jgi:hypothetical protein
MSTLSMQLRELIEMVDYHIGWKPNSQLVTLAFLVIVSWFFLHHNFIGPLDFLSKIFNKANVVYILLLTVYIWFWTNSFIISLVFLSINFK